MSGTDGGIGEAGANGAKGKPGRIRKYSFYFCHIVIPIKTNDIEYNLDIIRKQITSMHGQCYLKN